MIATPPTADTPRKDIFFQKLPAAVFERRCPSCIRSKYFLWRDELL